MPEASPQVADMAGASVGEGEHLSAALHGALGLPLPGRIAGPGAPVPLQDRRRLLARHLLHGHGAVLAHHHDPAVLFRVWAVVAFVCSVL